MTKREAKKLVCRVFSEEVWCHMENAEWVEEAAKDGAESYESRVEGNLSRLKAALRALHDELMRRGRNAG